MYETPQEAEKAYKSDGDKAQLNFLTSIADYQREIVVISKG